MPNLSFQDSHPIKCLKYYLYWTHNKIVSLFTFNEAIIDNFPILQSSAVADQEIC